MGIDRGSGVGGGESGDRLGEWGGMGEKGVRDWDWGGESGDRQEE